MRTPEIQSPDRETKPEIEPLKSPEIPQEPSPDATPPEPPEIQPIN